MPSYKVLMDGSDALPDENAQERKYRNGAARPGLQHETGDAHSGRWRIDGSDPRLKTGCAAILSGLLLEYKTAFLHNLAQKRSVRARAARRFYPQEQTSSARPGMSVWCQKATKSILRVSCPCFDALASGRP